MADAWEKRREQIFPAVSAEQLARLVKLGSRRRIAAGEIVFEQGSSTPDFYVVLSGGITITQRAGPSATDAQALLTLMQILFSDPLLEARRFWNAELREGMTLAEFESKFPRGSEGYQHFINWIAFWETIGSLMRRGLLNEDLAFDTFLDAPPWKRVATILKEKRERDKQPLEAVNFEWIANRAAQWIARHEHEAQPK